MRQCQYANEQNNAEIIERNHQEIEQAIDDVTGKNAARQIQHIWSRLLK